MSHDVGLLQGDRESELLAGVGQFVYQALQPLLAMRCQSSVISEQQFVYQELMDFGFGAQSSDVEEFSVCPGVNVDTFLTVCEGIVEEHGEKDSKKGRREHAALFHSTADWKGIRGASIEADGAVHVLVEGGYDGEQFRWTTDLLEDLEESTSAH